MTGQEHMPGVHRREGGGVQSTLICLILLSIGIGALYYIFWTEPSATRETATKKTPMLVNVTQPASGSFRPTIEAMGTVKPARDIILRPRVQGEIVETSENFTPGGFVSKGETLVRLDSSDYKYALQQRTNELRQARSDLQLEKGRQKVAQSEYRQVKEQLSDGTNKELILREPQLESARASVEVAKTAVEQARLELKRTTIEAPFDAHVVTRDANIGSQVAAGDRLARLVGLDRYWIEVRVPLSKLPWITIPDGSSDQLQPAVRFRDRNAWPEETYRTGHLARRIGVVGEQTRMARLLVEVPDPLSRSDGNDKPPLMIDAPVHARIKGKKIENTVKLNREYIRKEDTVWVMKDGKLDIRDVEVAFRDRKHAYIRDGLNGSDQVVMTNLTNVTDGAPLRTQSTGNDSDSTPPGNSKEESSIDSGSK